MKRTSCSFMDSFTRSDEASPGAVRPDRPRVPERRDPSGLVRPVLVVSGHVQRGRQLGRALGAATANVALGFPAPHLAGSYAAEVEGLDRVYQGCAHLGICPSVGGTIARLETHLFDFDADIYGALLTVRLLRRVSLEAKLESLVALERKIARDLEACHTFFDAPLLAAAPSSRPRSHTPTRRDPDRYAPVSW
jgi:Riboflavin kinase